MPKIKYDGPFDEIEIPSLGLIVKKGDSFEVADEDVITFADQAECFAPHDKAAKEIVKAKALEAELAAESANETTDEVQED
jgi:hypothetical protein